jgi:hypothetical protein
VTSLPPAEAPNWRQYVFRAILWVAVVGSLAYAASQGAFDSLENAVSLRLEPNRDAVQLVGSVPPVIEIKVTLQNNTPDPAALKAPSACKVFRWQVFSRSGEMVQTRVSDVQCPELAVSAGLQPGQKLEEFYSITLVPSRYIAGQDYQVRVWYWGYESEFQFSAE